MFNQFKNYLEEDIRLRQSNSLHKSRDKKLGQNDDSNEILRRSKTRGEKMRKITTKENSIDDNKNKNQNFNNNTIEEIDFIFVKKWIKTKYAIIFRFSNKTIQVCFKDRTQIIMHTLKKKIIYINKNLEKKVYPFNKALDSSNHEMNKRVKYTKEILAHMMSVNKQKLQMNINNNIIKEDSLKK